MSPFSQHLSGFGFHLFEKPLVSFKTPTKKFCPWQMGVSFNRGTQTGQQNSVWIHVPLLRWFPIYKSQPKGCSKHRDFLRPASSNVARDRLPKGMDCVLIPMDFTACRICSGSQMQSSVRQSMWGRRLLEKKAVRLIWAHGACTEEPGGGK